MSWPAWESLPRGVGFQPTLATRAGKADPLSERGSPFDHRLDRVVDISTTARTLILMKASTYGIAIVALLTTVPGASAQPAPAQVPHPAARIGSPPAPQPNAPAVATPTPQAPATETQPPTRLGRPYPM